MIINDFFTNPERSARNVAENSQRVDSLVTDALRVMRGPEVSDAVLALKRVLGDREYNGRRGFYSFYVDQILDMYGQQNLAEGADDYLDSDPATGTGDETHELDTGPLTQDPDADYDGMMQPMEQEGNLPTGMRFQSAAGAAPPVDNVIDTGEQEPRAASVVPGQSTTKLADKDRSREDWVKLMGYDPFDASRMAAAAGPAAAANSVPARKPDGSRLINANGLMAADDFEQYMKDLVAAEKQKKAAKQQANSVPASNAVSSNGKTEPVRMSMTMMPGGGEINNVRNPNIDDATVARARAWAAKQNAPAANNATAPVAPAWQDIVAANKIANPDRIYPGQKLTIPGRGQYEVQPGDTLSGIAAGNTRAAVIPKATPTGSGAQSAINSIFKKNPNLGVNFPIPPAILTKLGMAPQTKQDIAKQGRETLITPAMLQAQKQAAANAAAYDDKLAAINNRKKTPVKETDVGNTMDDGFKWGSATMPMQDGSVHKYNPQTNSYSQASPPTRPNLNTNISTISRDRTTDKNGQANQNYSDVSIATNPATGTGDYMHRQDVNGAPTTTFRQNVPAAELAKLRSQHFNEDINRMQNLAGIRKK